MICIVFVVRGQRWQLRRCQVGSGAPDHIEHRNLGRQSHEFILNDLAASFSPAQPSAFQHAPSSSPPSIDHAEYLSPFSFSLLTHWFGDSFRPRPLRRPLATRGHAESTPLSSHVIPKPPPPGI
ncbi:hypothetical protein Hypma_004250 [Hypsizygus marmoreus]|uniref:Uncharacterized protein n=1 Tax=Hypsizygus marmoreus TaxID=39966 RepID=A0A369J0F4_HYPMA|nr:hypothetical protein Hypma_004250 [Hypsizygus marmoreus]